MSFYDLRTFKYQLILHSSFQDETPQGFFEDHGLG